jgi:Flp pilus assembly protein TadG
MLETSVTRTFSRSLASSRGAALVEMAVVLPFLGLILVGTIDFGRVFHTAMAVTKAARAGAQYGTQSSANAFNVTGMQAQAQGATPGGEVSAITANASLACWCTPDAPASSSYVETTIRCNGTLPGGGTCPNGTHFTVAVTVRASTTFTTVSSYPGIPRSVPITRTVTMREQ